MVWYLQSLHTPCDPPIALPREGSVTIGRRPQNQILCKDIAVSGQHCILHCRSSGLQPSVDEPPEVEDSSTNGSYVNELRISKGQRQQMSAGDVLSLTKPPEEVAATADVPPRVQYRLDFRERCDAEVTEFPTKLTSEVPPTAPDPKPAPLTEVGNVLVGNENCFAQDLLVQEQQSKAKITAQLLQSQGKLEEERQAAEAASRELEKVRKQVAEERARRHEAEENRDKLAAEADTLRNERRQLQELRAAHEELKQRHEVVQLDLQSKQQKCSQLEAVQEQLRKDLEKAVDGHQKASQQHAELQTRARQAQERSDRLEQQYAEAKREADWAQEESNRLQSELATERASREKLENQVSETKEHVAKAEASERSARENLDAATAKLAELKCQASSAHADMEGARAAARQAQQRFSASKQLVERLQEAGQSLSVELKRRADIWEKALADGNFEALDEAIASGGPTFAQVTCQVETPPTKSQHDDDRERAENVGAVSRPQVAEANGHSNALTSAPEVKLSGGVVSVSSTSVLTTAATALPEQLEQIKSAAEGKVGSAVVEVAIDDDEDDLLAAAVRDPAGDTALPQQTETSNHSEKATALPGCSTAWSLEVLDAPSAFHSRENTDLQQPAKRPRLTED